MKSDIQKIHIRLNKIQGQLKGVDRMMAAKRPCEDIVMQLMAARSSLEQLTVRLIEEEANICVRSKSKSEQLRLKHLAKTLFTYT